ncbi:MAG: hypothetical protein K0Q57_956 [Gammaproteobacteria bacterium]|nr:hypothetical protein [Gammaproteobacteria bacterium]
MLSWGFVREQWAIYISEAGRFKAGLSFKMQKIHKIIKRNYRLDSNTAVAFCGVRENYLELYSLIMSSSWWWTTTAENNFCHRILDQMAQDYGVERRAITLLPYHDPAAFERALAFLHELKSHKISFSSDMEQFLQLPSPYQKSILKISNSLSRLDKGHLLKVIFSQADALNNLDFLCGVLDPKKLVNLLEHANFVSIIKHLTHPVFKAQFMKLSVNAGDRVIDRLLGIAEGWSAICADSHSFYSCSTRNKDFASISTPNGSIR